jgi:hypothetical protein
MEGLVLDAWDLIWDAKKFVYIDCHDSEFSIASDEGNGKVLFFLHFRELEIFQHACVFHI